MLSDFYNMEVECPTPVSCSKIQVTTPENSLRADFLSLPNVYHLLTRTNPQFERHKLWMYALKSLSPFIYRRAHSAQQQQYQYREYIREFIEQRIIDDFDALSQEAAEIFKDLKRTYQDSEFYGEAPEYYKVYAENLALEYDFSGLIQQPLKNANLAALMRVLLIYSKTNIERYTQGQNELASVLFYTLKYYSNDPFEAESAAFYCIINMMRQMRSLFHYDDAKLYNGLIQLLERFQQFLQKADVHLYKQLKKEYIEPHVVVVSWILSFFSYYLSLIRCVRLWDFLLAESFLLMNELYLAQLFGLSYAEKAAIQNGASYKLGDGKNLGDDFTNFQERQWPDFLLCVCIYYLRAIVAKWHGYMTISYKIASFQASSCFEEDCDEVYAGSRYILSKVEREFKWKKGFYKQYGID